MKLPKPIENPPAASTCVDLLGANIYAGDLASAVMAVVDLALSGRGGYVSLYNAHVSVAAREDEELAAAIRHASFVFPDGWPVAQLVRRYAGFGDRITGTDLMLRTIDHGRNYSLRHVLFGSRPQTLSAITSRVTSLYPGARIVGAVAPPMFSRDQLAVTAPHVEEIIRWEPHIVWCGLGAPKQELWMMKYRSELERAVLVGVGAAFQFVSQPNLRAPLWMQRVGLEWSHRLSKEPGRLIGRYARTNTRFVLLAAAEILRRRSSGRAR